MDSEEKKYELVAQVIAGATISSVAYDVGINPQDYLLNGFMKYKIWGYNGLVDRRRSEAKEPQWKNEH